MARGTEEECRLRKVGGGESGRGSRIDRGVLYRRVQDPVEGHLVWQLLVPTGEAYHVWQQYHQPMGHLCTNKLEAALKRWFFWPGMGADVRNRTRDCAQCVVVKASLEVKAPLVPLSTSYPLEVVAMDHPGDPYPYFLVFTD
ncbi:hypothetical protein AAFF_G00234690 [Aldrovandia affinis]|uniref:Gypsy retrotransposon integrase-like protein 1 n=1 Tax=Aldrovandia affinis TaxID=143900 RepID=A0AAD7WTV1_9TELE|nr:hypothetical protein AAFF_G00234690 [Aldrovandia affinis]